jgi:hypothetical protein
VERLAYPPFWLRSYNNVTNYSCTPNSQTVDTNSAYLAKFCFGLGIQLKRVEVIPDDEEDIMEAVRRMSARYDFVVTSGGIGPTSVLPCSARCLSALERPSIMFPMIICICPWPHAFSP